MNNSNTTYKLAYFHFPRTGGSFLSFYMREFLQYYIKGIGHLRYRDVKEEIGNLPTFLIIRNPFSWYISRYFYYVRPDYKTEGGILKGVDKGISGPEFMKEFPDFKTHFLWGMKNVPNFSMMHCFEQICMENDEIKITYIGKTESLEKDFNQILESTGIPIPERSLKLYSLLRPEEKYTNCSYHYHYRDYYDKEIIDIVLQKDKFILETFNYTF